MSTPAYLQCLPSLKNIKQKDWDRTFGVLYIPRGGKTKPNLARARARRSFCVILPDRCYYLGERERKGGRGYYGGVTSRSRFDLFSFRVRVRRLYVGHIMSRVRPARTAG